MNPDAPIPVEIGKPPLDDTLIRNTVEEVRVTARRAHRIEIVLVLIAALLMVVIAGFTGYNTYRLRNVNRNLTGLVESLEANQEALQTYNEDHALSAGKNLEALLANIRCFTGFFVGFNEAVAEGRTPPDKAILDACFQPSAPPPPPTELPSEEEEEEEE